LLGIGHVAGTLSPFTNNLGIAFLAKDFFPYLQISGNVWVAGSLRAVPGDNGTIPSAAGQVRGIPYTVPGLTAVYAA